MVINGGVGAASVNNFQYDSSLKTNPHNVECGATTAPSHNARR